MFGENQENKDIIDPALDKAKKSMGWRVDPDEPTEPVAPVIEAPAVVADPEPVAPATDPTPPVVEEQKIAEPPIEHKKIERPEAFIPMPKYLNEKKETEKLLADKDARIEELERIASQHNGADKDADIQEFMEQTGFDEDTVRGFLDLAEKRFGKGQTMSQEERDAVAKATQIVKEAELNASFNEEFKTSGEPTIKKAYPNATPEQLAQAKDYLDQLAHTLELRDKPLDFIVWKHQEELGKIFTEETPAMPKKTIESSRVGSGKQSVYTASDFKDGKTDFAVLNDLDPSTQAQIVKDMDSNTYGKFVSYVKNQSQGVEVMREGRKVILK